MRTLLESINESIKDSLHESQIDESILSSNNVGIVVSIENWWKKTRTDVSDFEVRPVQGGYAIYLTDWHMAPSLHTQSLTIEDLNTMPKALKWIYLQGRNKETEPISLNLNGLKISTLDLSHMDYGQGTKDVTFFEPIRMFRCSINKIAGMPMSSGHQQGQLNPINCMIKNVDDMKIDYFWNSTLNHTPSIDKIRNCEFINTSFSEYGIPVSIRKDALIKYDDDTMRCSPEFKEVLDEFFKSNTIKGHVQFTIKGKDSWRIHKEEGEYIFKRPKH